MSEHANVPGPRLRQLLASAEKMSSVWNQMFIDRGRGNWRVTDIQKAAREGDDLSMKYMEAVKWESGLRDELNERMRYHGNHRPIRRANPAPRKPSGTAKRRMFFRIFPQDGKGPHVLTATKPEAIAVAHKLADKIGKAFVVDWNYADNSGGVPPSSRAGQRGSGMESERSRDIRRAANLFERFTGHEATVGDRVKVPAWPKVGVAIGVMDGVLYTTTRDGRVEKYIHKFHERDKPEFVVSPDGRGLFMVGGRYDFTERGIVDKSDKSR